MKKLCCLLAVVVALCGCVSQKQVDQTSSEIEQPQINYKTWEKYGAVFDYDTLTIKATFDPYVGFETKYTIKKKLRVLSQEGVKYATFHSIRFGGELESFQLTLLDANGQTKKIDVANVKAQFVETGKIVVPQVENGYQAILKYNYKQNKPFDGYEYILNRAIPVMKGTVSLFHSYSYKYRYKSYETDQDFKLVKKRGLKGIELNEYNIEPFVFNRPEQQQFFLNNYKYQTFSRAAMALTSFRFNGRKYGAADWKELSDSFKARYYDPSLFSTQKRVKQVLKKVVKDYMGNYMKADSILKYVQNNISVVPEPHYESFALDIDKVLEEKMGTVIEIAAVLSVLYKEAGLSPKHYMTRSKLHGGFDPDFPSWGQMQYPVIVLNVDGVDYVAFPYLEKCKLGEYLPELNNQYALDLDSGKPVEIPDPINKSINIKSATKLSLDENIIKHTWDFTFGNQAAIVMRVFLDDASKLDLKEFAKTILASYGIEHRVVDASYLGNSRGENAGLWVRFENKQAFIDHQEGRFYTLSSFFKKYFSDFNTTQQRDYINEFGVVLDESVMLKQFSSSNVNVVFKCIPQDNKLFKSECYETDDGDRYTIGRKLTFKKVTLSQEEKKLLEADINQLNEILTSYAIVNH